MGWVQAAIAIGGAILSSEANKSASSKGNKSAKDTLEQQLNFARENRDLMLRLSLPYRQAANPALAAMMDMMGLDRSSASSSDIFGGFGGAPAGSDLPQMTMRKKNKGMSMSGLTDDYNAFKTKKKVPRYRQYARDLEEYLGEDMPEGIWEGKKGRTRPKKSAKRKRWRQYSEALLPYAEAESEERALENAQTGVPGLDTYDKFELTTDPGYQFRLNEGSRALDASASSKGQLYSGGAIRDTLQFGQDMASQEYMNIYNRLSTLAGYGTTAMQSGSSAIAQYSGIGTNAIGDYGATRTSAYVAEGNAEANLYGDLGTALGGIDWGSIFNSGGKVNDDGGTWVQG